MTPTTLPKLPADGAAKLQALLDAQTSSGRVPSAFLTVVTPDEVLFTGAAGTYDPVDPASRKVTTDDVMWFASTTKLITSVCEYRERRRPRQHGHIAKQAKRAPPN